jgi:hypothetical protein
VALAVAYQTVITSVTNSSLALWTSPSTGYVRDVVITNSGASTLFVSSGTGVSSASTTVSFGIPTGQSLVLEGQLPSSTIFYGFSGGTAAASIGYASVVSVI